MLLLFANTAMAERVSEKSAIKVKSALSKVSKSGPDLGRTIEGVKRRSSELRTKVPLAQRLPIVCQFG